MSKITKDTTVGDVFKIKNSEELLKKHSFPCLHCPMAQMEQDKLTIGQVCEMYSLNLKKILEEINKTVK